MSGNILKTRSGSLRRLRVMITVGTGFGREDLSLSLESVWAHENQQKIKLLAVKAIGCPKNRQVGFDPREDTKDKSQLTDPEGRSWENTRLVDGPWCRWMLMGV